MATPWRASNDTDRTADGDADGERAGVDATHGTLTLDARRQLQLHAERELQRQPTASPTRSTTATADLERRDGDDHGHGVNDAPVAVNDACDDGRGHARSAAHVLAQRHRRRRAARRLDGGAGAGADQRHADAERRRQLHLHAERELQRHRTASPTRRTTATADSNVATVTITVTAVNDAPVAVNDADDDDRGHALDVAAPGVLGNDTDDRRTATTLHGGAGVGDDQRHPDAERGRQLHLHAERELQRRRQLHLQGERRRRRTRTSATVTITVGRGQRRAGGGRTTAYDATEDTPLTIAAPGVLGNDTDVGRRRR